MILLRLLLITLAISLSSCKTYPPGGIVTESKGVDMPLKSYLVKKYKDSALVYLMIPKEISIQSNYKNDVALVNTDMSTHKPNSFKGMRLLQFSTSLKKFVPPPRGMKMKKGKNYSYILYLGYKTTIRDSIILTKLNQDNFSQNQLDSPIYNIGELEEYREYLTEKIPDSIRGFVNFLMNEYGEETRVFHEYISIKF